MTKVWDIDREEAEKAIDFNIDIVEQVLSNEDLRERLVESIRSEIENKMISLHRDHVEASASDGDDSVRTDMPGLMFAMESEAFAALREKVNDRIREVTIARSRVVSNRMMDSVVESDLNDPVVSEHFIYGGPIDRSIGAIMTAGSMMALVIAQGVRRVVEGDDQIRSALEGVDPRPHIDKMVELLVNDYYHMVMSLSQQICENEVDIPTVAKKSVEIADHIFGPHPVKQFYVPIILSHAMNLASNKIAISMAVSPISDTAFASVIDGMGSGLIELLREHGYDVPVKSTVLAGSIGKDGASMIARVCVDDSGDA